MHAWIDNIHTSLILGGALFLLLFFPGLMWQYRRHGRPTTGRMIGWLMVCVYAMALFVYTFVPLPDDGVAWCAANHIGHNFHPFQFVSDIRRDTAGMSLLQTIESFTFLQVFFNVVLFIPFGAFVRRYFGRSIPASIGLGFLTTVFIETSQYTGIFGIYPCSIRVGDVDDVIMNTLGAAIGAILAPALLWWLEDPRALTARRLQPQPVTVWRRWTGMVIDAVLFGTAVFATEVVIRVVRWMVLKETPGTATWESAVSTIVAVLFVFLLPALSGKGASAGQTVVWLTPTWVSRDGTALTDGNIAQRILRSLVVIGPWAISDFLPTPFSAIGYLVVLTALIMVPFTRSHRSLSGVLTGAVIVDARVAPSTSAIASHSLVHPRPIA